MPRLTHPLLEIRAWNKFDKQWYYLSNTSRFRIKLGPGFNVIFSRQPAPRRQYKLSFFTGLWDANRRRIYEGDILLRPTDRTRWKVVFDGGRFDAVCLDHAAHQPLYLIHPAKYGWCVLGDIYANPELL